MKKYKFSNADKILFEKIIEDATVDCHDEDEQMSGWFCIIEENIQVPCKCFVGKKEAVLKDIDQSEDSILGLVVIGNIKIRTLLEDIYIEDKNKMKYINAYKYWRKYG
ncbi:MAG: hypothetical protein UR15_C0001G0010 [Parcubacteria group bacterium GW2011_GWA2_31_28]|nr:MAG: hypothetical protein UR15_C0001G0010 [Parcubacteria group bacterium GW2011_GWA2_31_28]